MKKYQSYKSTGIEWIGKIPSHWEIKRVSNFGVFSKGNGIKKDEVKIEGFPCIRYGEIYTKYDRIVYNTISFIDEETSTKSVKINKGDILFTGSGETLEDIGKSILYYGEKEIFAGGDIIILKLNDGLNPLFVSYLLNTDFVQYQKSLSGRGEIIVHIYSKNIKEIKVPLPPIHEQQQIVEFLDEKTELIDKLISTKEHKITLLKQQKNSLINQVITKGLDPNVKMKESGVEWIGEIPEHWKISKLGFYTTKIGSGSTPRGGSEIYADSGIPFVRSQNVHFDGLRLENVSYIDMEIHKSMKGSTVTKNDVLLNITGGSIGRCCVITIDEEMNVNQHVSIIRTTNGLINFYLNYILSSDIGQSQVLYNLTGGNREGLTIEGIRNFLITIPPISEQKRIIENLDSNTKEIDELV